MQTRVAIIGAGPSGLLLSEILAQQGIESIVLERETRQHVLARIRAGVLEQTTVDVLRRWGLARRLDEQGHVHDGMKIVWAGRNSFFIDVHRHCGKRFTAYGQSRIQEDLYAAADARGAAILHGVRNVRFGSLQGTPARVAFEHEGQAREIECDFIAGCDGFHGVSRPSIPAGNVHVFDKTYPFGWLGVLSETPPLHEIIYANHPRGFALASQRSPSLSRYYIQVPMGTDIAEWPDERFWAELKARFPQELAERIVAGPSIEKSIAPLRSFVAEPMRHGRLFLAGDAAHIVPPTGAKGLNLAVSDIYYLSRALAAFYRDDDDTLLEHYSDTALRRVWHSERTSWYLTRLLHRFPDTSDFDQRMKEYELEYLLSSPHAQAALAEQYAGLPLEGWQ
ncbi:MAG: 4-hydroxybenzoate 3-monooxygenase [Burkholderiaceae bacterium]|nr:4-hydroxybenzoate 3-monooxygenase [Burkholderiaceae bacterium]